MAYFGSVSINCEEEADKQVIFKQIEKIFDKKKKSIKSMVIEIMTERKRNSLI